MLTNDLVTVAVPVYNAQDTIAKTVASLQAQTYTNLDILLINDGSSDNSLGILRKLASEDPRIRIFDQENAGVSAARNKCVELAKGPYFTFVDSDDGKLYKLDLFKGIRFPEGRIFEDEITALKLFMAASKTVSVDKALYFYVQNTGGLTKRPKLKHATDLLENEAEIEEMLKDTDIDKKALYARLCSNYTLAYNIVCKCSNDSKLLKEIRQKNNACYKNTTAGYVKCQPNGTSVILLRSGVYRALLGIRKIFSGKRLGA